MSKRPLEGIRIVDFGQIVAVPYASRMLAWLGAEVILVESEERVTLRILPPFVDGVPGADRSGGFISLNNNKLSCTININKKEGVELVHRLISVSDIFVENYTVGTLDKFGFSYEDVRKTRPDIVYLSLTAFGRTGPLKDFSGFHSVVNLFSGVAAVTGYPDGHPRILGSLFPDVLTGSYSILAVLQALYHRSLTGQGQLIDACMVESMLTVIPEALIDYSLNGRELDRVGNKDKDKAPHDVFRCAGDDKWVSISVANDEQFQALCQRINHVELATDSRFADKANRGRNQDELRLYIEEWTSQRSHYEAMHSLQEAGVPAAATLNALEVIENPHFQERGFASYPDHPVAGRRAISTVPWQTDCLPPLNVKPTPLLAQDNDYVFQEILGLSQTDVNRYYDNGALWRQPVVQR
jgi:benzylsuccinate CoA-transferase BbsF subunit